MLKQEDDMGNTNNLYAYRGHKDMRSAVFKVVVIEPRPSGMTVIGGGMCSIREPQSRLTKSLTKEMSLGIVLELEIGQVAGSCSLHRVGVAC